MVYVLFRSMYGGGERELSVRLFMIDIIYMEIRMDRYHTYMYSTVHI